MKIMKPIIVQLCLLLVFNRVIAFSYATDIDSVRIKMYTHENHFMAGFPCAEFDGIFDYSKQIGSRILDTLIDNEFLLHKINSELTELRHLEDNCFIRSFMKLYVYESGKEHQYCIRPYEILYDCRTYTLDKDSFLAEFLITTYRKYFE